ncbi:MAG: sigma-54-dependent Fis family transcriptional regulator [Planctomycetes bacterium]|nr:sigma-54-dependent Fis family transcriptional regulator [Planctomycetota bacterium]
MSDERKDPVNGERILLVDDDQIILDSLGEFLRMEGYSVVGCESTEEAMRVLAVEHFHLVLSDVMLPGSSGLELLQHVRKHYPDLVVILITGYGTIESAVEAIKHGAYDYLTKPIIDDDVRMCVRRALQQQQLLAENRQLRRQLEVRFGLDNIIGCDHKMLKIFELIEAVADSRATILMTGESGTGKSLIARAIHAHSPRSTMPFVEVSCGSLPETLLESELFGYVRGAFTNALSDRQGKFSAADRGTLFLDEIASASPALQVKLLRVLQERQFEPVGSNVTQTVDVRVLLASNRDLAEEVAAGRFRQDLYYRVNVVNIELPALRERPGDIQLLVKHFLDKYTAQSGKRGVELSEQAIGLMQRYDWPGNVRELENCIERAVLLCREGRICPEDLPATVLACAGRSTSVSPLTEDPMSLVEALAGPESAILQATLARHGGNRQATADELQINRTTLFKKMKKYGLMG